MPIPDLQTLILPLLELVNDKKEHSTSDYVDILSRKFNLTDEEKSKMPPEGKQRVFDNRVFWAKACLTMSKLIENPRDGFFKITERGLNVLATKPDKLDLQYLKSLKYLDNKDHLQEWIDLYKKLILNKLDDIEYGDIYKWETIQHFQDNWTDEHNGKNIHTLLKRAFNKPDNNLWSGQNFLPYALLLRFALEYPEDLSKMFKALYDEKVDVFKRIDDFLKSSDKLKDKIYSNKKLSHYQDKRSVSVYLTLRYPDKYYLFKSSIFNEFCNITGYWEKTQRVRSYDTSNLKEYFKLCNSVREVLISDKELIEIHKSILPSTIKFEDNFHTLTQDFLYSVTTYLTKIDLGPLVDSNRVGTPPFIKNPVKETIMTSLNQILYGPPGTGKTYRLQSLFNRFTVTKTVQSREEYLNALIDNLTWWETVGAALLDLKKASVPEIEKHEFIRIKARQSGTPNVKPIIWGSLQSRTDLSCENVKYADRREPSIFWKDDKSIWTILEDKVQNEAPEIINFLNDVKTFKPATGSIQKNYRMVTFHQNFSYEDFVEGIKPALTFDAFIADNDLEYKIEPGIFYQACNDAAKLAGYDSLYDCLHDTPERRKTAIANAPPYGLFVDEVNRANVSSVLGELITLIEDDKRLGRENEIVDITLPYSKTKFGVPANLHIICTMNTADRSVEALDTALRRRFSFEPVLPDTTKLTENPAGIDLSKMLSVINERLEALLSKDHTIGHAWLMKIDTLEKLQAAFKNKILPLLQEFFYNDYAKIGLVLGKSFVTGEQTGQRFANFHEELASEYADKTIYTLENPFHLELEDFTSIYK